MKSRPARRHQARLLLPELAQLEKRLGPEDPIGLTKEQAHHIVRVLRLGVGDRIELLDGRGGCYLSCIASLQHDKLDLRCLADHFVPPSSLQLQLMQGLSAADHMDFSLQKGVELGLNVFTPVACERSVSRIDPTRAATKQKHWHGVAQAACMQSSNPWLPVIHPPQSLSQALQDIALRTGDDAAEQNPEITTRHLWMLDPYGSESLSDTLHQASARPAQAKVDIVLLVGPEAGLSEDEVHQAHQAGFLSVHLGPRTLRTETAALAAIASIQSTWGDWRQTASRWDPGVSAPRT